MCGRGARARVGYADQGLPLASEPSSVEPSSGGLASIGRRSEVPGEGLGRAAVRSGGEGGMSVAAMREPERASETELTPV